MTDSVGNSGKKPEVNEDRAGLRPAVLVVGAGPTGLLLAAELERRGVSCHLIDALPGPLHWDRATVVHPRSLQIFESMGLAEKFLEAGCKQRVIKVHSDGKLLGSMDLSTCGSVYGFNLGLSEEITESILTDYLVRQGGEVHRASRLVGLRPHDDGLLAAIEREGEQYEVKVRWAVGCDGLHSPTRELSGIGFDGHAIAKAWAVFDAAVKGWNDTYEGIFPFLDASPIILTALPGQRWRVYLRPSSDDSDLVADATSTLRANVPGASFVDVENPTRFHCNTKVAAKFRDGAVFLAGDAAHLCTPAEGHGMNSGLQDAFNLAWKLALVHQGHAGTILLDSYEAERRPVAERITESGDRTEHAHTATDPAERKSRDETIIATLADPATLHLELAAETELNIDYSGSPIIFGDADKALRPGNRLPDTIRVEWTDGSARRLHKLAHRRGHTLMLIAGPAADGRDFVNIHAALQEAATESPLFEAAVGVGVSRDLPVEIGYMEPAAANLLGVEGSTLFVMRPDGYIGLRADRDHLRELKRYSALVLAG